MSFRPISPSVYVDDYEEDNYRSFVSPIQFNETLGISGTLFVNAVDAHAIEREIQRLERAEHAMLMLRRAVEVFMQPLIG